MRRWPLVADEIVCSGGPGGRRAELAQVADLLDRAQDKSGGVLVVAGLAGPGEQRWPRFARALPSFPSLSRWSYASKPDGVTRE